MIKNKVLIVDDEPLINSLLKKYLEKDDRFEADIEENGSFILGGALKKAYDLVIFDVLMPKVNGLELLQYLKTNYPDIKTIAITGMANDDTIRQIESLGCKTILKKPIKRSDFIDAVCLELGI